MGLSMGWALQNFPNIAWPEYLTFGAYIGYTFTSILKANFEFSLALAFLLTGILGVLSYLLIFRPMIRRGASLFDLCVASVGLGLALRYIMQQVWGGESLIIPLWNTPWSQSLHFGTVKATGLWIIIIGFGLIFALMFHLILSKTKTGKAMRAVANNPMLASSCGINPEMISILVWFLGSGLGGIGGLFRAADTRVYPLIGWELLLSCFAVVVLGGIGSFYGLLAASYIVSFAENLSVPFLAAVRLSLEYTSIVSFVVIVIVMFRFPEGLGSSPVLTRIIHKIKRI